MTAFTTQIFGDNSNGLSHFTINEKPGVLQKIYNLSKKTLGYLARNQHAISIGLWSFVFTKTVVEAYEFLEESGHIFDLSSCNNMLCSQWINETTVHSSQDYHDIARRCLPTYPNYSPIHVYDDCMNTLCEYLSDLNVHLFECIQFKNESKSLITSKFLQEELVDDSDFQVLRNRTLYYAPPLEELWGAVCPGYSFTSPKSIKEAKRIVHCLSKACDYYSVFPVDKLQEGIGFLCNSLKLSKVNKLIKNVIGLQQELKDIPIEEKKNFPNFDFMTGVVGLLSNVLTAVVTGVIAYYTAKATKVAMTAAASITPVQSGLVGAMRTLVDNTQAIMNIGSDVREEISMDSLSSFAQTIRSRIEQINEGVTDLSETINQEIEIQQIGNRLFGIVRDYGNEINIGKSTIEQVQKIPNIRIVSDLGVVLLEKSFKHIEKGYSLRDNYNITYWSNIVNDYLRDYINYGISRIQRIQLARLKYSLMDWQGAFCHYDYPYDLFCKLPYPSSEKKSNLLPLEDLMRIFSQKTTGLCYSIWGDLWCNWIELIELGAMQMHQEIDCSSDAFFLNIEKLQIDSQYFYQIESKFSLNNCYNLTALFKV